MTDRPIYKLRKDKRLVGQKGPDEKVLVVKVDNPTVHYHPLYPENKPQEVLQMGFHSFNLKYELHGFEGN